MTMSGTDADVIDALVGITPGSHLDAIRARRPEARAHAQATYRALFTPEAPGTVAIHERLAVAVFVCGLHEATAVAAVYAGRLAGSGASPALRQAVAAAVAEARTRGPYGRYPAGPLSREDTAGPGYQVTAATRATLGPRLAAAFEHAHMLVFHPPDAAPTSLLTVVDAGTPTPELMTFSQILQ
jgi:CMD domain protein